MNTETHIATDPAKQALERFFLSHRIYGASIVSRDDGTLRVTFEEKKPFMTQDPKSAFQADSEMGSIAMTAFSAYFLLAEKQIQPLYTQSTPSECREQVVTENGDIVMRHTYAFNVNKDSLLEKLSPSFVKPGDRGRGS